MAKIDWKGWTLWVPLVELDCATVQSKHGFGAYAIAAGTALNRAVGCDKDGILHIGEASNLAGRIWNFCECACAKDGCQVGHMAGWRFSYFGMAKHFPSKQLQVRWTPTNSKKAAYRAEGKALKQHLEVHAELPPLNYKFNWAEYTG